MSRRQLNLSEESDASSTLSPISAAREAREYVAAATHFTDEMIAHPNLTSKSFLGRMLSTKSTISTTSSFANVNQYAHIEPEVVQLVHIGQGQCGVVWHLQGSNHVFKIALNEGQRERLWTDCLSHRKVEESFNAAPMELRKNICVPRLRGWVQPNNRFWAETATSLPEKYTYAKYALASQAIMPIPNACRAALIDVFCPAAMRHRKAEILADSDNKNCLIRIYLGRRDLQSRENLKNFRLANFPLLVNDLEALGVSSGRLAGIMADALAILHWRANVDANDVEFVFGSSPLSKSATSWAEMRLMTPFDGPLENPILDFTKRHMHLWLLDFNECKEFEPTEEGLKQICRAFWFNDPYYPRPSSDHPADRELWTVFRDHYLDASAQLTRSNMPQAFIDAVEVEGLRRRSRGHTAGASSLFGQIMG